MIYPKQPIPDFPAATLPLLANNPTKSFIPNQMEPWVREFLGIPEDTILPGKVVDVQTST